ncbi:MAG TPA: hypothetical protein VEK55_02890 [Xanthobacteraceae bacterium]|nr:hypothetical protein [Xanthobacteraceae bacterium]
MPGAARGRGGLGQQPKPTTSCRPKISEAYHDHQPSRGGHQLRSDGDQAARIIQDALGIESDDVANYCFPQTWPAAREQRARIIGDWLQTEARYLA